MLQTLLKLNTSHETYVTPLHKKIKRKTPDIKTLDRIVSSTIQKICATNKYPIHGRYEMDSHADSTVAVRNCAIIKYTDRSCDVSLFSDKYNPMKDVPIVSAATGYTSANGMNYIIIFNEVLYIPEMTHTLINPNQCQYFGAEIQENSYHPNKPMSIASEDETFFACLQSQGTVLYLDTWCPTQKNVDSFPHIELTSRQHWNPHQIQLLQTKYIALEEIKG